MVHLGAVKMPNKTAVNDQSIFNEGVEQDVEQKFSNNDDYFYYMVINLMLISRKPTVFFTLCLI